ncbi:MAG: hypothetical protein CMJ83_11220 [Planctomycetes bacterium]|nr:hypothetical protein [Planctomycetota bacterium]
MLRAGPFSDDRVIRLVNRRFVPFYFDLSPRGFAGDANASKFLIEQRPEFGRGRVSTPPVFVMTAKGEVLGEVSNYATTETVLKVLLGVLDKHPEYAKPGTGEDQLTPLERAHLLFDLCDYREALAAIGQDQGQQAQYLRARIHRQLGDWKAHRRALDDIPGNALADLVRMERAYPLWQRKDYPALQKHLTDFPKESARYTEARYHLGLALFHQDRRDEAIAVWKDTITGCSQDPWIYRADWAFCHAQQKGTGRRFSSRGQRTSLLKRIGYMGRRNPDLSGPQPMNTTRRER